MHELTKSYYTVDEYLDYEKNSLHKNEYYKGKIFPRSGNSINHNRITGNLLVQMKSYRQNPALEIFMCDIRIWVKNKDFFTYPDLIIISGNPEFYPGRDDTITNPMIIIEVISESTQNYDRGEKFVLYRSLVSFKEYILIDQYEQHVELFVKNSEGKWILTEYDHSDDMLKLSALDFQITLKEIYRKVEFKAA